MLKHSLTVMAVALAALPMAASATIKVYSFNLSATQEVPTNTSTAAGSFQLTVDDTANTVSFSMAAFNFVGTVTAAHIHFGLAGSNGSVVYDLYNLSIPASNNSDISGLIFFIPNSFGFATTSAKPVGLTLADNINAMPWSYYVNVHTTFKPGGEIRGQVAAIPEPGTYALLAMGLGMIGVAARRRRAG